MANEMTDSVKLLLWMFNKVHGEMTGNCTAGIARALHALTNLTVRAA